jgi:hypothetical protein
MQKCSVLEHLCAGHQHDLKAGAQNGVDEMLVEIELDAMACNIFSLTAMRQWIVSCRQCLRIMGTASRVRARERDVEAG